MPLILILLVWISSVVGMFLIHPMTGGWLLLGIVSGLLTAFVAYGIWLCGMDTYMEATFWLFPPIIFVAAMFSVYCLLVVMARGVGLHMDVSVH